MREYYTNEMSGGRIASITALGALTLGEMFVGVAASAAGSLEVAAPAFILAACTFGALVHVARGPHEAQPPTRGSGSGQPG